MPDLCDDARSLATQRPKRRFWRVSLRGLMLLVLVVGGLLGWQARRSSVQREAVARIKAAGAGVMYDFQVPDGGAFQPGASPWAPRWLRAFVGDEPFQNVAWVIMDHSGPDRTEPSDATINALAACSRLRGLNIYNAPLTDSQLERLSGLTRLKTVTFLDTKLTSKAFSTLARLPVLENLTMRFDRDQPASTILPLVASMTRLKRLELIQVCSDAPTDLTPLRMLTHLESLRIYPSPRDDACLEQVAGLTSLKTVDLRQTRCTDAGLRHLAKLVRLKQLLIDGSDLTDEGLAIADCWPNLETLYLRDESRGQGVGSLQPGRLTDRTLIRLAGFAKLNYLSIDGQRFTDAGVATLAKLPALELLNLSGVEASATSLQPLLAAHQFIELGLIGPGVNDACAPLLASQKRLTNLTFAGPQVTDASLAIFATLPALESLNLAGSKVTDVGLQILAKGTGPLETIDVRQTAVSFLGVIRFQVTRPKIKVQWLRGFGPS